ncbi:hypothetical protein [Ruegeria sp. Ofav3-42]|uniref:hypothetical protein n=1 Tax=Ruegeria sp. Ofav3-42 TaxID=2917759 RepID=UPI001EF6E77E|nr:hypothetical protein [Ruegeria sp. Ofav3-42]MCG7521028.1 hypothetical protein [Ruegeria sp. Ofav3-42]
MLSFSSDKLFKAIAVSLTSSLFAVPAATAMTLQYQIEIDGAIGTFEAPDTGGLLSSFEITIDGVTFDTLGVGNAAPVYDAVDNDIRGNPGTEGFILNSMAGGACLAMECILSLEDSGNPGVEPPLFAIFPLVGGVPDTVTNSGEYSISQGPPMSPIPLPAPFALLAAALMFLFAIGRRVRRPQPCH